MRVCDIYFSPTGGVEKVKNALLAAFGQPQETCCLFHPEEPLPQLARGDLCFISVPVYFGRIPEYVRERLEALEGRGAYAVLVIVYGNGGYGDALLELRDLALAQDLVPVAAISAIAQHAIFAQFGTDRPSTNDILCLKDFACRIKEHLSTRTFEPLKVPGRHPYRHARGFSIFPQAKGNCQNCQRCVQECPVHAIPPENPRCVNKTRCISCMHCVKICPNQARTLNQAVLMVVSRTFYAGYSVPKGNELFLALPHDNMG